MDPRLEKATKMLQDALDAWDKASYECGVRTIEPFPANSGEYWQPENRYGMPQWWPWRHGEWPKSSFTTEEIVALKEACADTPVSKAWRDDHLATKQTGG